MEIKLAKILMSIVFSIQTFAFARQPEMEFVSRDIKAEKNFVKVEPGLFVMGSPESEMGHFFDEQLHQVTITSEFEIQKTMVTQEQYLLVMGKNPSLFNKKEFCPETYQENNEIKLCPTHPVERVSWNNAQEFIERLNAIDKNYSYRLPTEAEWEYTARAQSVTTFWFGDSTEKIQDFAWYGRNSSGHTQAVGLKPANPFGLYDAHGNVWQWTNDWYGPYSAEGQEDPTGFQNGVTKVLRGGSVFSPAADLRAAARTRLPPQAFGQDIGFRLVRTMKSSR